MGYRVFLLNITRCIGCRSCELACKSEYHLAEGQSFRRIYEVEWLTPEGLVVLYLSLACNHCEHPECFRVCPHRTYRKRRDGVVIHEAGRCDGCGRCVQACPYKAPQFDQERGKVDKCHFCYARLDAGLLPVCVEACPTEALNLEEGERGLADTVDKIPGLPDPILTGPSLRFRLSGRLKPLLNRPNILSSFL